MLEVILDKYIIYVLMGAFAILGVVSKLIVSLTLGGMVRGAENMSKSTHPLMRLVRAKFEHACMVSEKVENVRVFVDKYLYEHRVIGVKLHSLRRMETASAGMCLVLGVLGAAVEYSVRGMQEGVLRIGVTGAVLAIVVFLVHLTTDENFRLEAARNYMVDYLENICLHRYEKAYQKETKNQKNVNVAAYAPEVPVPDFGEVSDRGAKGNMYEDKKRKVQEPVRPQPGREVPSPQTSPETRPPAMPEPYEMPGEAQVIQGITPDKPQKQRGRVSELPQEPVAEVVQISADEDISGGTGQGRKTSKKEKKEESKDILIRQILEEFMA